MVNGIEICDILFLPNIQLSIFKIYYKYSEGFLWNPSLYFLYENRSENRN